ncbi:MAG: ECF transporter S component [Ruminococcaceae bacterium]|nr:ECF transporter S component [Oscillospiraceae bacterium]
MNKLIIKLTYSALCLALGLTLPFLTGQIPEIGAMLCPMHFPVLLCGLLCGWQYGMAVGFVTPLLRSVIFGMPPMMTAIPMAFELLTYGLLAGLFYKLFENKLIGTYASLISAMVGGRIVWGIAQLIMMGLQGSDFPFSAFIAGSVLNAVPGIIAQIVLIPIIVFALERANLVLND